MLKQLAFPSRFFKSEDLPANGLRVVIDDMQRMQLGETKEFFSEPRGNKSRPCPIY
jgi:hypothetical protein